ncbi:DUF2695 domain-containing protein [Arthrobacter sp. H14-L1]|uniref:DUF2695 domain-containing protein n=1 Tax=Arthrobacter sp. H14-L1 TaxID=2996697 RepID=UPI003B638A42
MEESRDGQQSTVAKLENQLPERSTLLTMPGLGECLACYVQRMLNFGCLGLRWVTLYRDQTAPRSTALVRNLGRMGAFCDCEIFLNAYEPNPEHFEPDQYGEIVDQPSQPCRGVRQGSVQPCQLWLRIRR